MSDKFNNNGNKKNNDSENKDNINKYNKNFQNKRKRWNRKRRFDRRKIKNENQLVFYNNPNNNLNYTPNNKEFIYCINPNDLPRFYNQYTPIYDDKNFITSNNINHNLTNFSQTNNFDPNPFSNPFTFTEEFEKNIFEMLRQEQEQEEEKDKNNSKPKEFKWIKLPEIKNLSDLIEIGKGWGETWSDEFEYNINLKLLNSLVPELEELDKMVGLHTVKMQIIDLILFWALGLDNSNHDLLHTVIEGEPGTGKTELAEKLAKIYLKLGILKNDVFKKVKRADLIAGYLGQTAIKTAKVIEECVGGVLFIDEAYSLGNAEGKDGRDSFSKECIDTLNQALTESKNDFVCIIAGYADDLAKSFFSYNSGLERRFPIRFSIGTYTDEELGEIFIKKVKEYEWDISVNVQELGQIIKENRTYFKFNGGDMEILFAKCKISHSKNLLKEENKIKKVLDNKDIMDGIGLYLLNPEIKKRKEYENINKYVRDTMYV